MKTKNENITREHVQAMNAEFYRLGLKDGVADGAAAERTKIVAWLREMGDIDWVFALAESIERGDHLKD